MLSLGIVYWLKSTLRRKSYSAHSTATDTIPHSILLKQYGSFVVLPTMEIVMGFS
jgi:hypothetical protein